MRAKFGHVSFLGLPVIQESRFIREPDTGMPRTSKAGSLKNAHGLNMRQNRSKLANSFPTRTKKFRKIWSNQSETQHL